MKRLFTILLSVLIIIGTVGCSKLSSDNQPQIEIHETIECVDVTFSATTQLISINNNDTVFYLSGTSTELINWLNNIDTGEDIIYISYEQKNNKMPTYILAKKYHYYYGDNKFTWIISRNMIHQGIYFLTNVSE